MPNNKINSSSVKTQENQPEGSLDLNKMIQDPSNAELIDNSQAQQNKLFGLLKQSIKDFSKLPAEKQILAVSAAGGLLATALPLLLAAVPLAATGAMIGLALFFSVKAVQFGYKGLKWSAEKTVDGAKYTAEKVKDASTYAAGKIKDGAVYAKDSVKEGYEHSVDSLKRGASVVGEGVANKFHRASGKEDYSDKLKRFTEEENKKSDEIRSDLKEIFADKGNNSGLVQSILSGISSIINSKIEEKMKLEKIDQALEWLLVQGKFIDGLSEKSLHSLLTQRSLPKDTYLIDSVFSKHYDEIKEVIAKCKEDHILKGPLKMRNNMFEEGSARPSRSFSLPSFSSLGRKDSTQSTSSLSKSSSLDSVRTESTASSEAELLNPANRKEVKQSSGFFSRFKRNEPLKEATDIKYQAFSEPDTSPRQVGKSTFYVAPPKPPRSNSLNSIGTVSTATVSSSGSKDFATVDPARSRGNFNRFIDGSPQLTPAAPPKVPGSPSIDSGVGSGSSTPERYNPSIEESLKELDKTLEQLNSDISQLPSTTVTEPGTAQAGVKMKMD